MMKIILNTKELGRIAIEVKKFPDNLISDCREVVVDIAHKIRRTIMEGMQSTPKTGKKYRKGGEWHIASSPGNYPAIDESELFSRIVPPDVRGNEIEVGAEAGAAHGELLESGTSKMEARPWLMPSLEEHEVELEEDIGAAIMRSAEEAFRK